MINQQYKEQIELRLNEISRELKFQTDRILNEILTNYQYQAILNYTDELRKIQNGLTAILNNDIPLK